MSEKKILVLSLVVFVLLLVGYSWLAIDTTNRHNSIGTLITDLDLESRKDAMLRSTRRLFADITKERSVIETFIVGEEDIVSFITFVESLADTANVDFTINTVRIADRAEAMPEQQVLFESLVLATTATGNWSNIFHLISLIDAIPMGVTVERVNLMYQVSAEDPWRADMVLSIIKQK